MPHRRSAHRLPAAALLTALASSVRCYDRPRRRASPGAAGDTGQWSSRRHRARLVAPVVATSVNYLVGSDEAPAGFPGTAHAQEHMMFRGSAGLSADQLADIGSIMGGDFNANTSEA